MHEQAALLSCPYCISNKSSQQFPLFRGILLKSTVIGRFWTNFQSSFLSSLIPVFLGTSIFLPQHPALSWLLCRCPPWFSFFPSGEDIFMSLWLLIFPLKPTLLSLFSVYIIAIPLLLCSQFLFFLCFFLMSCYPNCDNILLFLFPLKSFYSQLFYLSQLKSGQDLISSISVSQILITSWQVLCYLMFYLKLQFLKATENKKL